MEHMREVPAVVTGQCGVDHHARRRVLLLPCGFTPPP